MDPFLQKTPAERALYIEQASARTGKTQVVIEKDFWVCWTLGQLFSLPEMGAHLTFKGGTSLSKAYGLIERFSEDIDVSFQREFLGFGGEQDPEKGRGNKERQRRIEALQKACEATIRDQLLPALRLQLSKEMVGDDWRLELDNLDPQTVLFHYPQNIAASASSYIKPFVRIELGARSDHWPQERRRIQSYLAETFSVLLLNAGSCEVDVLSAERTFWEKATILHAEYHRPAEKPLPERLSRHYYDLSRLAKGELAAKAMAHFDLLARVAEHKQVFFRSGWARYEEARPGSLRLVPDPSRLRWLEADYEGMREMFFVTPPPFTDIMSILADLEKQINKTRGRDQLIREIVG